MCVNHGDDLLDSPIMIFVQYICVNQVWGNVLDSIFNKIKCIGYDAGCVWDKFVTTHFYIINSWVTAYL